MLSWLSVFELDLFEFLPISCAMNLSFYHTLVIRTLLPLLLVSALAAAGHCINNRSLRSEGAIDMLGELGIGASCFAWCTHRT